MLKLNRRLAVILHDLSMVLLSWVAANILAGGGASSLPDVMVVAQAIPVVVLVQGLVFRQMGLYLGLWRFASAPDLWNIVRGVMVGALVISLALFLYNRFDGISRVSFLLYIVLLTFSLAVPRIVYRTWKDRRLGLGRNDGRKRVLILGAGRTAERLVHDMAEENEYHPIGFLDDNRRLKGSRLHGIPVIGAIDELPDIAVEQQPELLVIAIPSANTRQMQRLVELCEETGIPFRTVPRLKDMVFGHASSSVKEIREVDIADLLDREPVNLDWGSITEGLVGKNVLITGGGGSIGAELCRQVACLAPASLIVLEKCEFNLYRIDQELRREFPNLVFKPFLGDVTDAATVDHVMKVSQPDVMFHAAAYKHVPMLQGMIREAVANNVLGTRVMAEAAGRFRCETFVLVSTDKAVNPTNTMGATKRVAELICQELDRRSPTRYITVRFGNVLGSTGSVVPLFKEQIQKGGPVTVTHPDITRYFMTVTEACHLIMEASVIGRGGEIFVLDMDKPVRISDLAEQMIRLSGKQLGKDIQIVYSGLRPGEKLYEELFHENESLMETGHSKVLLARPIRIDWARLNVGVNGLAAACKSYDEKELKALLREIVPEFRELAAEPSAERKVVPFVSG